MSDSETEEIQIQSGEVAAEPVFHALDPRVIRLWQWTDLIAYSVLQLILTPGLVILAVTRQNLMWWLLAGWLVLESLLVWASIWRPRRAYESWGYRIDDRVLETRSGIFFHRTRLLPLSRIQHVDLERGPIERRFGLSSLVLFTAGTHAAKTTVPGLEAEDAIELRDHLVAIGGDDAV